MANALLYNLAHSEKGKKVRFALFKLGIRCRDVAPDELAHPVGYLAGLPGYAPGSPYEGTGFSDEMVVMNGFSRAQLDAFLASMRRLHLPPITLKAIVTEYNAAWTSLALHDELAREHEALRGRRAEDAQAAALHRLNEPVE